MKNRFLPLALAGALILTLAACGGGSAETPTPAPTVPAAEDTTTPVPAAEDTTTPIPAAEDTTTPVPAQEDTTKPAEAVESGAPSPKPTNTVQSHPIETPEPSVEPSAEPETSLTAADVYAAVSAKAGGSAMVDSSFALDAYYAISADDLEDFVLYMPDMSANIEEIFIAKVKSGKMDAVKTACEGRQKGMAEDAAFYPDTGTYVDGYQLVTNGDWLLFCVCENPADAVSAFNGCTK